VDEALDKTRTSDDPAVVDPAYKFVAGEISKDGPIRIYRFQQAYVLTSHHIKNVVLEPTSSGAGAYWEDAWIDK
jgi:hypothetical protein